MNSSCIGRFRINGELLYDTAGYEMIAELFSFFKIVPVRCEQLWHEHMLEYTAVSEKAFLPIKEGEIIPEYECVIASKRDEESEKFSLDLKNCSFKKL